METCGKHLAPNMQTISSIFKGALTTFRIAIHRFITRRTFPTVIGFVTLFAVFNIAFRC